MKLKWTIGLATLLVVVSLLFIIGTPSVRAPVVAQVEFTRVDGLQQLECVSAGTSKARVILSSRGVRTTSYGVSADGARVIQLDAYASGASIRAELTQNGTPSVQCWSVSYRRGATREARLLNPTAEASVSAYALPLNARSRRNIIQLSNEDPASGTSRVSLRMFNSNGSEVALPPSFAVVTVENNENINLTRQFPEGFVVGSLLVSAVEGSVRATLRRDAGANNSAAPINLVVSSVVGVEAVGAGETTELSTTPPAVPMPHGCASGKIARKKSEPPKTQPAP